MRQQVILDSNSLVWTVVIIAILYLLAIYVILLESASWGGDIENDYWKSHYQLLNDEYKKKIDGRTAEELAEEYESSILENVNIWKN